jgi:hypothetical protein
MRVGVLSRGQAPWVERSTRLEHFHCRCVRFLRALFRYDPRLAVEGKNPFQLDSRPPSVPLEDYIYNESRYTMLRQSHPELAQKQLEQAKRDAVQRWRMYEAWAALPAGGPPAHPVIGESAVASPVLQSHTS